MAGNDDSIKSIRAREILDSRGNPTVEVELQVESGVVATAGVPSGASTGSHEAFELRDGGKRYGGKGVQNAVAKVNSKIAPALEGMSIFQQQEIDALLVELDGTENKSNLGANAAIGTSMAVARAAAKMNDEPLYHYIHTLFEQKHGKTCHEWLLPCPQMNVLNGGRHAGMEYDVQETMVLPIGAKNFSQALQMGAETYQALKSILKKKFGAMATLVGDEGGFAPAIGAEEKLELLSQAISGAGYENEVRIGMDPAASEFFDGKETYQIGGIKMNSGEVVDFYSWLSSKFKIVSIEDGLSEDDWAGWKELTARLGSRIQIVGDDLLTTNPKRIKRAVEENACNSLLLKVNQIGTVSESLDAAALAMENGWSVVVSHRSGETEDAFIADLAVGLGCGQIKAGAPARSERVAKYNRLLKIEEELAETGGNPAFGGKVFAGS